MIKPHTCFSWGKGFFLQKRQQLLEFALTGKLYPLLSATTRFSEVCVCRSNKDDKLLCTGQKTRNTHTHTHTHFAMLFRICLEIREVALFRRNYLCTYPIKKKNRRCNLYSEQHFFFFFFGLPSMAFLCAIRHPFSSVLLSLHLFSSKQQARAKNTSIL